MPPGANESPGCYRHARRSDVGLFWVGLRRCRTALLARDFEGWAYGARPLCRHINLAPRTMKRRPGWRTYSVLLGKHSFALPEVPGLNPGQVADDSSSRSRGSGGDRRPMTRRLQRPWPAGDVTVL